MTAAIPAAIVTRTAANVSHGQPRGPDTRQSYPVDSPCQTGRAATHRATAARLDRLTRGPAENPSGSVQTVKWHYVSP